MKDRKIKTKQKEIYKNSPKCYTSTSPTEDKATAT